MKKEIINLNENNNNNNFNIIQTNSNNATVNKASANLINAPSKDTYKVNTDVNENMSFTNSKQKEVFANIKDGNSPNNSIEKAAYFEVDQERINLLEQIVDSCPKIILEVNFSIIKEVISSSSSPRYNLSINAQGIEGSLRGKKDGFIFFGVQNEEEIVK